jgi:raffinose/stachyose/melibiose transport system substrate-binding protein
MKKNQMLFKVLIVMCVLGLLAACAPAATQAPAATEAPAATQAPAGTEAPAATEAPAEPVTLSYLVDDSQNTQDTAKALADAYTALHPNVTITIETRPGGTDGDNIVKTRLATDDMNDIFWYNTGSLFQALHPTDTLVDLSNEPFIANIVDSFTPTVSADGKIYGVPTGPDVSLNAGSIQAPITTRSLLN